MAEGLEKTVTTFSKLHEAMLQTTQDSEGLVKRFADTSKASNKLWTTMSRLTIGVGFKGFWRFQSLVRSIGNVFELWYDSLEETVKAEKEMMDNTLGLYNAYEKIQDVKNNIAKTDDDAFKMMKLMMGEEKARAKLAETVQNAELIAAKKLGRVLGLNSKEKIQARIDEIKLSKGFTSQSKMEARSRMLLDKASMEKDPIKKAEYEEKAAGINAQLKQIKTLETLKDNLPDKSIFKPIKYFSKLGGRFMRGMIKFPVTMMKFLRLSTGLFRKLLIFTAQFMMYFVGVMLLIFAFRKPLMAMFHYFKDLYERWPEIKVTLMKVLEPLWNAVQGFWNATMRVFSVLFDGNSSFGDMLKALGMFVLHGLHVVYQLGKVYFTKFLPVMIGLVIKGAYAIGNWIVNQDWVGMAISAFEWAVNAIKILWNDVLKPWLNENGFAPVVKAVDLVYGWLAQFWMDHGGTIKSTLTNIADVASKIKDGLDWLFGESEQEKNIGELMGPSGIGGSMRGFAKGGTVGTSGRYLVGELGPEIVSLPSGAHVTPNHHIGGTTINVNVNGRVGASDQELRDIAKKIGFMLNREINRATAMGVR